MRRSPVAFVGLVAIVLMAGACDNGPSTAPRPPTTPAVTETFTGTINLNGAVTHSFNATAAGEVKATITAVDPTGSVLGFQLGTFDSVTCSAILSNPLAALNSVLSATTQSSANLCVRLHDPNGTLTAGSVNYTVTVEHR
jgi:hypothetical protein